MIVFETLAIRKRVVGCTTVQSGSPHVYARAYTSFLPFTIASDACRTGVALMISLRTFSMPAFVRGPVGFHSRAVSVSRLAKIVANRALALLAPAAWTQTGKYPC